MLFYSMFKTLVGKEIAVELKNDVALTGTLHSIDQYLNIKLLDARVVDAASSTRSRDRSAPRERTFAGDAARLSWKTL